jgi:hypothetical protein
MMPGQTEVQHPAKKPYTAQKAKSAGSVEESPQIKNTPAVVPIAEMMMQVVTCSLSVIEPIITDATVAAILTTRTVSVDVKDEVPNTSRQSNRQRNGSASHFPLCSGRFKNGPNSKRTTQLVFSTYRRVDKCSEENNQLPQ